MGSNHTAPSLSVLGKHDSSSPPPLPPIPTPAEASLKQKYGIGQEHGEVQKLNAEIDLRNRKSRERKRSIQVDLAHADDEHDSDLEDVDEGNAEVLKAKYGIGAANCETTALDEAAKMRNKRERKRRASLQVRERGVSCARRGEAQ